MFLHWGYDDDDSLNFVTFIQHTIRTFIVSFIFYFTMFGSYIIDEQDVFLAFFIVIHFAALSWFIGVSHVNIERPPIIVHS